MSIADRMRGSRLPSINVRIRHKDGTTEVGNIEDYYYDDYGNELRILVRSYIQPTPKPQSSNPFEKLRETEKEIDRLLAERDRLYELMRGSKFDPTLPVADKLPIPRGEPKPGIVKAVPPEYPIMPDPFPSYKYFKYQYSWLPKTEQQEIKFG